MRRGMAILACALGFMLASSSAAGAQVEGAVAFEESGMQSFKDGTVTLHVRNRTSQPQPVTFELGFDGLKSPNGGAVRTDEAFTISPPVTINGEGRYTVTVTRVSAAALAEGSYNGTLRLLVNKVHVDDRQLGLKVKAASVVATPMVDKWTVVAKRFTAGFRYESKPLGIPLKDNLRKEGKRQRLATLTSDSGRTITVYGKAESDTLNLELRRPRGATPGKYEGKFDLLPDDDKAGEVALTVIQRDSVFLPALVLVSGLLAGLALQRWLNAWRRLGTLHQKVKAAAAKFAATVPSLSVPDVEVWRNEIGQRRSELMHSIAPIDAKSEKLKTAEQDAISFEAAADAWEELVTEAPALTAALAAIPTTQPPTGALVGEIAFVTEARALLAGNVPAKEVVERLAAIKSAKELASQWPDLRGRVGRFGLMVNELERRRAQMQPRHTRLLDRAWLLYSGVVWDLWHAKDGADLLRRTAVADLEAADAALGELSYYLSLPVPGDTGPLSTEAASLLSDLPIDLGRITEFVQGAVSAVRRLPLQQALDRTLTALTIVIAVAASVWVALVTNYFDKPFGTGRDYIVLLVWALGTAATLDVINAALGKFAPPAPPAAATTTATPANTT